MLNLFNRKNRVIPIEKARFKPLKFNLSDNILEISIPDNVSPDMPPTELIPELDINSAETFRESNKIPLMKVMYDFPKPGWRKRDYGSVVLTLWLHKKPATYGGDIFQREHLIKAIQVDLKNNYQSFNDRVWNDGLAAGKLSVNLVDEMMNFCGNTDEWFNDFILNDQLWVRHFITGLESHEIYCGALSTKTYLCFNFEFMSSTDVYLADLRDHTTKYIEAIMKSVKLTLANNLTALSKGVEI